MGNLPFETIKRKILVKRKSETSSKYGCKPEERSVEELIKFGVVNINKPSGPTSHQIVDYVKSILCLKKAGHSGTLDPKVTGCLPTALDKATRVVQVLLTAGKEYVCLMYLHKEVEKKKIEEGFVKFSGEITQLPPVRSAVKREERKREIYYTEILEFDGQHVLFKIGCEAGTYIRKFVHDLGKSLGCGAHMAQLVRTKAGPFSEDSLVSLHDLHDAYTLWKEGDENAIKKVIFPFENAVGHLGKIWAADGAVDPLCHGADLYAVGVVQLDDSIQKGDLVAVFTLKNELICIGNADLGSEEIVKSEKGVAVKTSKVFMDRGIYKFQNIG